MAIFLLESFLRTITMENKNEILFTHKCSWKGNNHLFIKKSMLNDKKDIFEPWHKNWHSASMPVSLPMCPVNCDVVRRVALEEGKLFQDSSLPEDWSLREQA